MTTSILLPVLLALVGILAGWLNCFDKEKRKVTMQGWVILAIITITTIIASVSAHNDSRSQHLAIIENLKEVDSLVSRTKLQVEETLADSEATGLQIAKFEGEADSKIESLSRQSEIDRDLAFIYASIDLVESARIRIFDLMEQHCNDAISGPAEFSEDEALILLESMSNTLTLLGEGDTVLSIYLRLSKTIPRVFNDMTQINGPSDGPEDYLESLIEIRAEFERLTRHLWPLYVHNYLLNNDDDVQVRSAKRYLERHVSVGKMESSSTKQILEKIGEISELTGYTTGIVMNLLEVQNPEIGNLDTEDHKALLCRVLGVILEAEIQGCDGSVILRGALQSSALKASYAQLLEEQLLVNLEMARDLGLNDEVGVRILKEGGVPPISRGRNFGRECKIILILPAGMIGDASKLLVNLMISPDGQRPTSDGPANEKLNNYIKNFGFKVTHDAGRPKRPVFIGTEDGQQGSEH